MIFYLTTGAFSGVINLSLAIALIIMSIQVIGSGGKVWPDDEGLM